MTAVANCLSCDVAFLTAASWYDHLAVVHNPRGETVCVLCELPISLAAFAHHPCVGRVFAAAPAAAAGGSVQAARPRLSVVRNGAPSAITQEEP